MRRWRLYCCIATIKLSRRLHFSASWPDAGLHSIAPTPNGPCLIAMPQPVFHAPDHDHERCTADALAHAETLCAQRSQRLTPIRRQVLEVLLESHKPLGAYEIMDRAAVRGSAAGADHDLSRARFPARQRPRASDRKPQRLRRLRQQSRQRRSRGVPDLRALRRGRRGAVRRRWPTSSRPPPARPASRRRRR